MFDRRWRQIFITVAAFALLFLLPAGSALRAEAENVYTGMVFTTDSGVLSSGLNVRSDSTLSVTEISQSSFSSADAQTGSFYKGYTISLNGDFNGTLKLHFPLGQAYNGENVRIVQEKTDGTSQTWSVSISDGFATIETSSLGNFAFMRDIASSASGSGSSAVKTDEASDEDGDTDSDEEKIEEEEQVVTTDEAAVVASQEIGTVELTAVSGQHYAVYLAALALFLGVASALYLFVLRRKDEEDD